MSQKSILAKLLATENISVQHGNYETAWFDIKNRVLGLPQWVDKGKDVSDLLIGHEVGHALETPFEGWHDSPEKLEGCPRTYINVVEDARIERKIKSRYVGLVGPFQRGYKKLFEDGFFGEDHDFNNIKLIDKINLKAKVGAHLNIPFNPEEEALYNATMTTDTFEDVIQVVKDILAYTKDNTPELIQEPEIEDGDLPSDGETEPGTQSGHDDFESESSSSTEETKSSSQEDVESDSTETKSADSEDSDDRKETNDSSSRSDDENTLSAEDVDKPAKKKEEDVSQTDEAFRNNERKLLDVDEHGDQDLVIRELSPEIKNASIVDYKTLMESRKRTIDQNRIYIEDDYYGMKDFDSYRDSFKDYLANAKRSVNFAVKEFEQRKAAFRWTRAETARSGSIDVNKLWSYKTDDDIFAKVTRLADAKNHGLIGLIDYSGSMSGTMGNVLDQVVHLSLFCKAVNIPFDIYGFTTERGYNNTIAQMDGEMRDDNLSMPQIVSSSMRKAVLEEALYHCYVRKEMEQGCYADDRWICSEYERYGSTPLNQALNVSTKLIKDFKRKHNVEKMNLVVISDGDTNRTSTHTDYKNTEIKRTSTGRWYNNSVIFHVDGRVIKANNTGRGLTQAMLEDIQKAYNTTTVGFFITNGHHDWKGILGRVFNEIDPYSDEWDDSYREFYQNAAKEYRKNKCFTSNALKGYDEFYVIKGGTVLETAAADFDPDAGATKGQITAAFKRHSKSKKNNKVLLTNFGRIVA